jgi:hypothetical protein
MTYAVRAVALALACIVMQLGGIATAQTQLKQIPLNAKQVEGFIAAQKDMAAITEKIQAAPSDKPDPKILAELEAAAKKQGFQDFAEYDDVAANIAIIMAGIDPQTKTFTEPQEGIKKEIAEVTADKTLSETEKTRILEDLNEALKAAKPIQHAGNIELIKSYFERLEAAMQ